MNNLERRIIELSFRNSLTHISSCLNTVNTLHAIYAVRDDQDPVILGNSHAALALYVVLEEFGHADAEKLIERHGTHAGRDMEHGIWCSGGSLGQAETIAVGMAMADRERAVWLVTSDGALAEGCTYEALRFASELNLRNLNVYVIANGYGGYGEIDEAALWVRLLSLRVRPTPIIVRTPPIPWPWLQKLGGHYNALNKEQYDMMMAPQPFYTRFSSNGV